ncbi:MAG: cymR [Flavisolibacter sp.]|jgi:Rrf2 family protein|nr:cymR [Flavisolibacter sp.]
MLSQKAKYALQALSYLAAQYTNGNPVLIGTIARDRNIPIKFLEAILCELKNHDVLISSRGRSGGYRLSMAPKNITLAKVIRIVDGPIALLSCVSLNFYKSCDNCNQLSCGINPVMAEARDALLKVLEKRTVKDIMDKELPLLV